MCSFLGSSQKLYGLGLVWWWHPELVWKGCCQSETALPYASLKESYWFHPQLHPHTRGWLQNMTNCHEDNLSWRKTFLQLGCQSKSTLFAFFNWPYVLSWEHKWIRCLDKFLMLSTFICLLFPVETARVVCYFSYYSSQFNFSAENVKSQLCTHIMYVYSSINPETYEMQPIELAGDRD